MLPLLIVFHFFLESATTQIFSETVGKVIVTQNTCSVMPHRVWKRFNTNGPKPLAEYPPEALKFLTTWVHSAHGVEGRLENMLLKWDEQSICFDSPSTLPLKRVAHGGEFSHDMSKFSYLEMPEYWMAPNEEDLETWRNVKLEECSTTAKSVYRCPATAFKPSCTQKNLEKCSERIEMDSSAAFFTFARRLAGSHLVATKVRIATVIRDGNIFDIKPVELPERIFKVTLPDTDKMSIGDKMIKN